MRNQEDITASLYNSVHESARSEPPRTTALEAVATGTSDDPFAVLGRHATTLNGRPAVVIRTVQPAASRVELVTDTGVIPMTAPASRGAVRSHGATRRPRCPDVRLPLPHSRRRQRARRPRSVPVRPGPHRFRSAPAQRRHPLPRLGEARVPSDHGRRRVGRALRRLGARTRSASASSATSIAGTAACTSMRRLVPSGIWEIFIPDLADGACYKFEVRTHGRAPAAQGRSLRAAVRGAAEHGVGHLDGRRLPVA